MKTINKLITGFLAFLFLSVITLPIISKLSAYAQSSYDAVQLSLLKSMENADKMQERLGEFSEAYNEEIGEKSSKFTAEYVEFKKAVYMTESDEYAVYMDFDYDNGYLLIDKNSNIYEFNPQGDLSYMRNSDNVYYNGFDKFMWFDNELNIYKPYSKYYEKANTFSGQLGQAAGGQKESGDGYIENIEEYATVEYPAFKMDYEDWSVIPNYFFKTQGNVSFYNHSIIVDDKTELRTENNCMPYTIYSMMENWRRLDILSNLPKGKTDVLEIMSEIDKELYSKFGTGTYAGWTASRNYYLKNTPDLYLEIRKLAIERGYTPEVGMYFSHVKEIVETISAKYGYNLTMKQSESFEDVRLSILNGVPAAMGIYNSVSYKDHGMALYGYVKYSFETKYIGIPVKLTRYFFAVDDGASTFQSNRLHVSDTELSKTSYKAGWFDPNKGAECEFVYKA